MSEGIPFRKLIAACLVLFGLIGAVAASIGYFYSGVNNISFVAPAAESSGDEFSISTVTDSRPTTEDDTGIRPSSPRISNRQKIEAQKAALCADKMRSLGIMAEKCLDIEPLVKALRQGVYIFNKPERAYVGTPFRIVLVLKTDPSQDPGPSFAKTVGPQESVAAAFGQLLDATLRGTDLTVDPSGPQRRAATLLRSTEWEWIVTPTQPGDKILTIEVLANLMVKNSSIPYQIRTLQTDIQISVATFERLKNVLAETKGALLGVSALASLAGLYTAFAPFRRRVLRILRVRRRQRNGSSHVKNP